MKSNGFAPCLRSHLRFDLQFQRGPTSPVRPLLRSGPASLLAVVLAASTGVSAADTSAAPGTPASPAAPQTGAAVLQLEGGARAAGALRPSKEAGLLRWKSPHFTAPFDFELGAVKGVHWPTLDRPGKSVEAELNFELSGGDLLFGTLLGLGESEIELEAVHLGRLKIGQGRLLSIRRANVAEIVHVGPSGLSGWQELPGPLAGGAWRDEGGQLVADTGGVTLYSDVGLPPRSLIEIDLVWGNPPDFSLSLGVDATPASLRSAFRFEVWEGRLVALRETAGEADFAVVLEDLAGAGTRGRFRLYLDQEAGRLLVHSADGSRLADLTLANPGKKPLGGLALENRGGGLRLERLRVSRWNGSPPQGTAARRPGIERADGTTVAGTVSGYDPATRELLVREAGAEIRVPLDQVAVATFAAENDQEPGQLRVVYQDGSQLSGSLVQVEDEALQLEVKGSGAPVRAPLSMLRALLVRSPRSARSDEKSGEEGVAARIAEEPTARIELEGTVLPGRLVDGQAQEAASALVWQPAWSRTASPLEPTAAGRIVLRDPPPLPPPPHPIRYPVLEVLRESLCALFEGKKVTPRSPRRLQLRNGDAIPCNVSRFDDQGILFKTPLASATFLAQNKIKAVELVRGAGVPRLNRAKRERLLMLPRMQATTPPGHLLRSKQGDFLRGQLVSMDANTLKLEIRGETREIPRARVSHIIWLHADELPPPPPIDEPDPPAAPPAAGASTPGDNSAPQPPAAAGAPAGGAPAGQAAEPAGGAALQPPAPPAPPPAQAPAGAPTPPAQEAPPAPPEPAPSPRQALVRLADGSRLTFEPKTVSGGTLSGTSEVLGACTIPLARVEALYLGTSAPKGYLEEDLLYQRWKLHRAVDPVYIQVLSAQRTSGSAPGTESSLVGKPAPDFELELLKGKTFRLSAAKGKVVVLDFWATWCGPCLQLMPQLERRIRDLGSKEVELVAVNLEEPANQVQATLDRHKLEVTVALDRDGVVANKYEATSIPQTVVIDREGKVARLFVGGGPLVPDQVRDAVRELLPPGQ